MAALASWFPGCGGFSLHRTAELWVGAEGGAHASCPSCFLCPQDGCSGLKGQQGLLGLPQKDFLCRAPSPPWGCV